MIKNSRTAETITNLKIPTMANSVPTIKQWTDLQTFSKVLVDELTMVNNVLSIPQTGRELNNCIDINLLRRSFAAFEQKLSEIRNGLKK